MDEENQCVSMGENCWHPCGNLFEMTCFSHHRRRDQSIRRIIFRPVNGIFMHITCDLGCCPGNVVVEIEIRSVSSAFIDLTVFGSVGFEDFA